MNSNNLAKRIDALFKLISLKVQYKKLNFSATILSVKFFALLRRTPKQILYTCISNEAATFMYYILEKLGGRRLTGKNIFIGFLERKILPAALPMELRY